MFNSLKDNLNLIIFGSSLSFYASSSKKKTNTGIFRSRNFDSGLEVTVPKASKNLYIHIIAFEFKIQASLKDAVEISGAVFQ